MRFQGLDLNLLITLEVILVQRNLTKAADILSLTQPAVSNALTKLREHFGDELLQRHGRDMERTEFAQQLLKPLQDALLQMRRVVLAKPHFDAHTASRTYRVVASDFIATVLMGEFILRVARLAPNVTIELMPLNDDSIGKFSRGEADALILPDGRPTIPSFPKHFLFAETFVCIAGKHNSSVGGSLSADELQQRPRVVPPHRMYYPDGAGEQTFASDTIAMPFSSIPWFVAKSEYVAIIPHRLAAIFLSMLPIRLVALDKPPAEVAFIAQSHPSMSEDRFNLWMLEQLQLAAQETKEP
jgi:LysR family nod box-dependent transcriptional activator